MKIVMAKFDIDIVGRIAQFIDLNICSDFFFKRGPSSVQMN